MLVTDHLRFRQPAGVDDGGMVQGIAENKVVGASRQGGDHSEVGAESRLDHDGCLRTLEGGEFLFQFYVGAHGPCYRSYCTRTDAVLIGVFLHLGDQPGIVAEAEVVVGAEVQVFLPVNMDPGSLGAFESPDRSVESGLFHGIEFFREKLHGNRHGDHSFVILGYAASSMVMKGSFCQWGIIFLFFIYFKVG